MEMNLTMHSGIYYTKLERKPWGRGYQLRLYAGASARVESNEINEIDLKSLTS